MGLLYSLGIRIMNFMIIFLIVILLPGLPPRTTFPFKEFEVAPPKALSGALEPNNHLDGADRLLEGRVYGPESLIARKNDIYMGIHGGEVIKMNAGHITHVTKIGHPCEDITEESRCGRPLGLSLDTQSNSLLIADAYYGLWQVDLTTNKKQLLVSPQQELPGKDNINRPAKTFNSVTVDKQGTIYWTDSTSDFTLQDLVYGVFANPSGRLFKYDRTKNESKLLLDELFFANGVALSPEEDFIVVAETGALRLIKYWLKGSNAGKSEIFVEGLPGHPDNLTPDSEGIWVPLVTAADSEHPSGFTMFSRFPSIRLFLARMLTLMELPFKLINNAYPNKISQRFIHFIGHGESVQLFSPKRSTIVRVDWNGHIVGSLHGFDKSVGSVSHVLEFNENLLLGSPFNRFIARVKNPKTKQPTVRIGNVRYEGAGIEPVVKTPTPATTAKVKVTTTTKKPTTTTTTTPKPTTTTTTTPKPTTTTPKPTTTTSKPTTTTPKPTTTTPKPTTTTTPKTTTTTTKPTRATTKTAKPTTTTTPKPATTTTTPKPTTTTTRTTRIPPKQPAPVEENIPSDIPAPKQEKLKVITKLGDHVEL